MASNARGLLACWYANSVKGSWLRLWYDAAIVIKPSEYEHARDRLCVMTVIELVEHIYKRTRTSSVSIVVLIQNSTEPSQ